MLKLIRQNKPEPVALPPVIRFDSLFENTEEKFRETLAAIYTEVIFVKDMEELVVKAGELYAGVVNRATTIPELGIWADFSLNVSDPHELETIEIAILKAEFGVAENGAVWVTDNESEIRVLPFITQHLAVVLQRSELVANMHQAYDRIGLESYPFGAFIAGPSKTADIEQSLVLGAHGPKSMTVFLVG